MVEGKGCDLIRAEPSIAPTAYPLAPAPAASSMQQPRPDATAKIDLAAAKTASGALDKLLSDPNFARSLTAHLQQLGALPRMERTHEDNDADHGLYPRPKWPVNHASTTFEAMAVKKAMILSPPEIYAECAHHGEEKAKFHWLKLVFLSVIAGCYVGFGFTLCLMVGGNMPKEWSKNAPGLTALVFGAVGFPFAFTMIVVNGAELYTSMCAYSAAAWWEGKVGLLTILRLLATTWCGNFAGCGIFVGLMYGAGVYEGRHWYADALAMSKVHHPWGQALLRGVFANWLVGIATWQANAAQDLTGKAVAIWLPISAFAMMGGLEHVIANQFLLPMALALGDVDMSAAQVIWHNLVPATLGNWIGGAVCVSTTYAFIYGTPGKQLVSWVERVTPPACGLGALARRSPAVAAPPVAAREQAQQQAQKAKQ